MSTSDPSSSSQSQTALKSFSLLNNITEISPQDEIFRYDPEKSKALLKEQPWKTDPHYFKSCKISAVALIKMVIHARSGVPWEIMGLMQGKVIGTSLVVVDSFALPVQGTETRVNAQEAANEYMVEYVNGSEKVERKENVIGWYHSHPGYACWLSGIDVNTQITNQKYQDPFVAVVIDPNRTISAGKVDIGAFRTYPENYTPPTSTSSSGGSSGEPEYQSIPLSKIEDFGVHANQYYQLEIEVFKSRLDDELLGLLWNKYWVDTLSSSALISNRAYAASQLSDLAQKLARAQSGVSNSRAPVPALPVAPLPGSASVSGEAEKGKGPGVGERREREFKELSGGKEEGTGKGKAKEERKKEDSQLVKSVRDSTKLAAEAQHGLITQVLKDVLFSRRLGSSAAAAAEVSSSEGVDAQTQTQADASRLGKVVESAMGVVG